MPAISASGIPKVTIDASAQLGDDAATETFWTALIHDSDSYVAILDSMGRFRFANDVVCKTLGLDASEILTRSMEDVFPLDFAKERVEVVNRVCATRRPAVVIGMCMGSWNRAVYRPIPGEAGERHALCVCRPFAEVNWQHNDEDDGVEVIRATRHDLGHLSVLTDRELEVLRLIGEALSTADIAKRLQRSAKTVEWHRVSLGEKLGVVNRVELARIAMRSGLSLLTDEELDLVLARARRKRNKVA